MSVQYLPGAILQILNQDCKPAGEVEVDHYIHSERSYQVWWTYPQTGEREKIKVPEWRLMKKTGENNNHKKTNIRTYADRFFRN